MKTIKIGVVGGLHSQLNKPNPMHVQAFLKGGRIHKSAKTYSRKQKHKKDFF